MFQEVTPPIAYQKLKETKDAILIDCRTEQEWINIGVPDLSTINKSVLKIELLRQDQSINHGFIEQVEEYTSHETPLYLICRSGARSAAACKILLKAGFNDITNVAEGFEGHSYQEEHPKVIEGWKSHSLPWKK